MQYVGLTTMDFEAKVLPNEMVTNWLIAAKIEFNNGVVCSTTRHLHTRKGPLDGTHWLAKLLYMLEDVCLSIGYL